MVRILWGAGGKVGDGEADVQGAMACGSQRKGSKSGLRPDDGGGVAIAYVDAGWGGICLVREVGWLAFEVACQVHEPQHLDGVADAWCWSVACPPRSAWVGAAFISPMMIVGASMAIWRYASARAWRKGFCGVAKGDVGVDDVELPSIPDDLIDT